MTLNDIEKGESKTQEFKLKLPKNENIAKTIIAFSNTSGGKLIIGVNNEKEIVGVDEQDIFELMDKVASIVFDMCSPNILPEIYTINIQEKLLLVIEVFRGNLLPYFLKSSGKNKGTYIRVGATNQKADFESIIELERQKRHISYDEEIYMDLELSNLDLTPLNAKFRSIDKNLNQEKLLNLKLIKQQQNKTYPTNALMIILGKFPHTAIKCAKFKGVTMEEFIDKKEYNKDIFSTLENSLNFILNHINLNAKIEGLQRTDSYEIPIVALREALINALVHRDYTNFGKDIKVGIYDDIVNIVSPGSFPSTITEQDLENGRSEIRNKVLANVFKELGLIEQWGSGIKRIKILCEKIGLKTPKIQEQNDFVDVEIYRKNTNYDEKRPIKTEKDRLALIVTEKKTDYDEKRPIKTEKDRLALIGLSLEEQEIILYLNKNSKIQRKNVMQMLNVKETKAKNLLKKLMGKNAIKQGGKGRSVFYELNEKS